MEARRVSEGNVGAAPAPSRPLAHGRASRNKSGKDTAVNKGLWLGLVLVVALPLPHARANGWRKEDTSINFLNRRLKGKVLDFTDNHGTDNRIWSRSLYQRRDVHLPLRARDCIISPSR